MAKRTPSRVNDIETPIRAVTVSFATAYALAAALKGLDARQERG